MSGSENVKEGASSTLFDEIRKRLINFITSRTTVLMLITVGLGAVLINRCFQLQIVEGEDYLETIP